MGIEEDIQEIFVASEENLSEKYDRMGAKKMEALYRNDFRNLFLVYVSLGILIRGY